MNVKGRAGEVSCNTPDGPLGDSGSLRPASLIQTTFGTLIQSTAVASAHWKSKGQSPLVVLLGDKIGSVFKKFTSHFDNFIYTFDGSCRP